MLFNITKLGLSPFKDLLTITQWRWMAAFCWFWSNNAAPFQGSCRAACSSVHSPNKIQLKIYCRLLFAFATCHLKIKKY